MRVIVAFEKTAQVRHIGHLDMQRAMQRALRRSGLPIKYSQGFNPHALLTFASPLSVGVPGRAELFEIAMESDVTEEEFAAQFSRALPDSLPLVAVRTVPDDHPKLMASIKAAEYEVTLEDSAENRKICEQIPATLAKQEIMAVRKTKSGEKLCDIRPMLYMMDSFEREGDLVVRMRTALDEKNTLKPELVVRVLSEAAGVEVPCVDASILRTSLLGMKDGQLMPLLEC